MGPGALGPGAETLESPGAGAGPDTPPAGARLPAAGGGGVAALASSEGALRPAEVAGGAAASVPAAGAGALALATGWASLLSTAGAVGLLLSEASAVALPAAVAGAGVDAAVSAGSAALTGSGAGEGAFSLLYFSSAPLATSMLVSRLRAAENASAAPAVIPARAFSCCAAAILSPSTCRSSSKQTKEATHCWAISALLARKAYFVPPCRTSN